VLNSLVSFKKSISIVSIYCFFIAFDTENEDAFQTYIDEKIPLIATSFCWGDKGYVFIGTADDSLIQILLQFDREKQPFRTTRFAEEEKFKTDGSIGMFKTIRLHKLGLFCAGSDDVIRLITFENQDGTLQEANNVADLMDFSAKLTTLTFNQTYTNLLISSAQGIDLLDLTTRETKQSTLLPISLGKIVDVAVLSPASELVITARGSGALEAWSVVDGSRRYSTEIHDKMISHIVVSPNLPLFVVTTTTGYFYFYEINRDGFRLIHRIRTHSNNIRSIKFNPQGTLLVSTGFDNHLFIIEIKTGKTSVEEMFQVIYRTDLDGESFAMDLDDFENQRMQSEQDQQRESEEENIKETSNETRIVIALNTKTEKFGRFLIIDFDWQQYRGKSISFKEHRYHVHPSSRLWK
jgi:WD40 repeat protein